MLAGEGVAPGVEDVHVGADGVGIVHGSVDGDVRIEGHGGFPFLVIERSFASGGSLAERWLHSTGYCLQCVARCVHRVWRSVHRAWS